MTPDTAADGLIVVPSRYKMQLEICRALGIDPKAMGLDGPATSPWPEVQECFWPAPSLVKENHSCPQCDGSHDHEWVAGPSDPHMGNTPVRCRICGGRKCDLRRCLLRRHHGGDHEWY